MQATLSHKIRKTAGFLILAAIFLSVLASVSLPSILGFNEADREQASLTLPEKEMKECYDSTDPENEALEEIDLYQEYVSSMAVAYLDGSDRLFSSFSTHLPTKDSDIQIPPPEFIVA
jgi:hypothetical protein